jgi:ATP-dependent RNA helicase DHX37/DHR1
MPAPEPEDSDEEDEWNGLSGDETTAREKDSDGSEQTSGSDKDGSDDDVEETSESDDDSSEEDEEEDDDDDEEEEPKESRSSAFKAWAIAQRNEAQGFKGTEETTSNMVIPKPENFTPRAPEQDPLPQELLPTKVIDRKTYAVPVTRTAEIQEARLKLPV